MAITLHQDCTDESQATTRSGLLKIIGYACWKLISPDGNIVVFWSVPELQD
jgi:hypothetical protein